LGKNTLSPEVFEIASNTLEHFWAIIILTAPESPISFSVVVNRFSVPASSNIHHPRSLINRLFSLDCQLMFPVGLRFYCATGSCAL
jgi:hypothetical protein